MGRQAAVVLYVLALVAVVVGVDVLFFRNQFWERLIVNVGIVLVFGAFYFRFPEASMSAAAAMRLTQLHTRSRTAAGPARRPRGSGRCTRPGTRLTPAAPDRRTRAGRNE